MATDTSHLTYEQTQCLPQMKQFYQHRLPPQGRFGVMCGDSYTQTHIGLISHVTRYPALFIGYSMLIKNAN